MKKVLLSKSAITFAANKTAQLPASTPSAQATENGVFTNSNNNSSVTIKSSPPHNASTYQQRKVMQPAYSELFRALLRLPKDVQQRVTDAINGVAPAVAASSQICIQCKLQRERKYTSTATQTVDPAAWKHIVTNGSKIDAASATPFRPKTEQNSNTTTSDDETPATTATLPLADMKAVPVKKRRKRKICEPQVIKRSHAQQAQAQLHLQTKTKKRKTVSIEKSKEAVPTAISNVWSKRVRSDSTCSSIMSAGQFEFIQSDGCLDFLVFDTTPLERMRKAMAAEFLESEQFHDGLLPVHDAIIKKDKDALRRQIFVWTKMKKLDLNELLTDEDEDCLQLAVVHNCQPDIIEIILEAGLITNGIDAQSNSIIHLALLNAIQLDSFALLLKRIDLMLLLQLNDDGHTPLHIAVRHDLYAHAEILLNVLDERLGGTVVNMRYTLSINVIPQKDDFSKFYQHQCDHLHKNVYAPIYAKLKLKRRLLECGEMRSGNTALFVAIENKMEHFIYFLLAHLSDPLISNHGGQNAKSYFGEFSKVLDLSLKIDQTMEKVINGKNNNI